MLCCTSYVLHLFLHIISPILRFNFHCCDDLYVVLTVTYGYCDNLSYRVVPDIFITSCCHCLTQLEYIFLHRPCNYRWMLIWFLSVTMCIRLLYQVPQESTFQPVYWFLEGKISRQSQRRPSSEWVSHNLCSLDKSSFYNCDIRVRSALAWELIGVCGSISDHSRSQLWSEYMVQGPSSIHCIPTHY